MSFIAVYHKFTKILKKHEKNTKMTSSDVPRLEEGGPNSRGGSKAEFILKRREGEMGRGNWWMLASPGRYHSVTVREG